MNETAKKKEPLKIGKVAIDMPVFLAPMAGVTDMAYRILARRMGCGLLYSEMVSEKGIHFRNEHTLKMLKVDARERPLAIQLFGNEPEGLAEAAKYVESLGVADIIDINMGCPAPKIVKNDEGSALLKDPPRAHAIMAAVKKAVKLPVTVKMRMGWDSEHINVVEMARLAEDAGMDAIAVHGRTREQFYSGQADWQVIAAVKKAVKIPVIGNGDVRTCRDLARIFSETACDAVMIGRAAQGNPWIFKIFSHYLKKGEELSGYPSLKQRKETIMEHLDMLIETKGAYIGSREMRKHATWYTRGLTGGASLRRLFNEAESRADFASIVEAIDEQESEVEK